MEKRNITWLDLFLFNRGNGDPGFQLYRYHKNVGTIGLLTARTPPQETITNEITIVNLKNREN